MTTAGLVVAYNSGARLARCVASLRRSDFGDRPLLVVDNASRDGGAREVAKLANVELLSLPRNVGFAAGVNAGLTRLLDGKDAGGHAGAAGRSRVDAVLLVNPDCEFAPDFFAPLEGALAGGASLVGPKLVSPSSPGESRRIWSAGGRVTFGRNLSTLVGHRELDRGQYDVERDVDLLPGTVWLARRELFAEVGLLDEAFFCYVEDVDFCLRAVAKGRRLRYVPSSMVVHEGSASSGGGYTPLRKYLNARNGFVLLRKHGTFRRWCRFVAGDVLTLPLALVYAALRGRPSAALWKARGLVDGMRRRPFEGARRAALLPGEAA
jgi:GT2 family glycosyltransferase